MVGLAAAGGPQRITEIGKPTLAGSTRPAGEKPSTSCRERGARRQQVVLTDSSSSVRGPHRTASGESPRGAAKRPLPPPVAGVRGSSVNRPSGSTAQTLPAHPRCGAAGPSGPLSGASAALPAGARCRAGTPGRARPRGGRVDEVVVALGGQVEHEGNGEDDRRDDREQVPSRGIDEPPGSTHPGDPLSASARPVPRPRGTRGGGRLGLAFHPASARCWR